MYRKILAIHLCTSLFCLAFLAMYGVSGLQLAHRSWFRLPDRVSEASLRVTPGLPGARAVARELMDRRAIDGELMAVLDTPGAIGFRVARPGTLYQVRYASATGDTTVVVRRGSFGGMLNALHRSAGLWHEYRKLNIWAAVLGLISLGLLLLGVTGLYLWFRNPVERRIGLLLLIGAGMAAALIASMRVG